MYKMEGERHDTDDGVPTELALDHRYQGLAAVIGDIAPGTPREDVAAWFAARPLPADQVVQFSPVPLLGDAPSDVPRDEAADRFLHLYFLDEDPVAVWDDRFGGLDTDFAASGLGTIAFGSPFLGTVPGTDTYTDQLW
jgi:hypothetical protein